MVQVREVVKVFDGKEVLRHLNMSVERGTIYGLLGANGAGKSTTFKLISGLLQPNAGAIQFDGEEIQVQDRKFLKEMGILIETPVFYEHLSARENLEIHLAYMGCKSTAIDNSLQMVGLADTGKKPVSKFSLGMKQRLPLPGQSAIHRSFWYWTNQSTASTLWVSGKCGNCFWRWSKIMI